MTKSSPAASIRFAALVQDFFCRRLIDQQNVSAQTVASYRDTFRLLLGFLQDKRKIAPASLTLADLDAETIASFLDHLESQRDNSIRTRNARFAAIRSFLKYAAAREVESLPAIQRVLTIPMKRFARPTLGYLSQKEVKAVLEAPSNSTWSGHRDRVLFSLLYNTGARVSEAVALRRGSVTLKPASRVEIDGKGRKQRVVPLWKSTAEQLADWLKRINAGPETPLFPNRQGRLMSRSGVERRLRGAVRTASLSCPTLAAKRISPHTLRHTTAMHLLQSGVDITVIAMWLGHESPATTHQYVVANLAMKEQALAKLEELPSEKVRYRPPDKLLEFLDNL
ncbi:MAG: integrase [Planctomycetes bacterium]|nr:integrase [Planctomycetota bacterium]